jgi:PPOX class probable FMN-dependent enzyme
MDHICTIKELRAFYRLPRGGSVEKEHASINAHDRAFIAHAPFMILATSDADGRCDVSPKGGPPGFVSVLDDGRVAIPDLSGNNRLDSLHNLLANPGIGLLFLIPGIDETLRVNGRALLSTDPDVLAVCAVRDVVPKVAIAVNVKQVYLHCAKALRRGSVWQPEAWPDTSHLPSAARMLRDQVSPEVDVDVVAQSLEDGYRATLWKRGG